jgi:hypothetical protein
MVVMAVQPMNALMLVTCALKSGSQGKWSPCLSLLIQNFIPAVPTPIVVALNRIYLTTLF